jgi:hypothetical protein
MRTHRPWQQTSWRRPISRRASLRSMSAMVNGPEVLPRQRRKKPEVSSGADEVGTGVCTGLIRTARETKERRELFVKQGGLGVDASVCQKARPGLFERKQRGEGGCLLYFGKLTLRQNE